MASCNGDNGAIFIKSVSPSSVYEYIPDNSSIGRTSDTSYEYRSCSTLCEFSSTKSKESQYIETSSEIQTAENTSCQSVSGTFELPSTTDPSPPTCGGIPVVAPYLCTSFCGPGHSSGEASQAGCHSSCSQCVTISGEAYTLKKDGSNHSHSSVISSSDGGTSGSSSAQSCWGEETDLSVSRLNLESSDELLDLVEDKEIAARAVAFVVTSTRKGIVPLCADVASLMRANRKIKFMLPVPPSNHPHHALLQIDWDGGILSIKEIKLEKCVSRLRREIELLRRGSSSITTTGAESKRGTGVLSEGKKGQSQLSYDSYSERSYSSISTAERGEACDRGAIGTGLAAQACPVEAHVLNEMEDLPSFSTRSNADNASKVSSKPTMFMRAPQYATRSKSNDALCQASTELGSLTGHRSSCDIENCCAVVTSDIALKTSHRQKSVYGDQHSLKKCTDKSNIPGESRNHLKKRGQSGSDSNVSIMSLTVGEAKDVDMPVHRRTGQHCQAECHLVEEKTIRSDSEFRHSHDSPVESLSACTGDQVSAGRRKKFSIGSLSEAGTGSKPEIKKGSRSGLSENFELPIARPLHRSKALYRTDCIAAPLGDLYKIIDDES